MKFRRLKLFTLCPSLCLIFSVIYIFYGIRLWSCGLAIHDYQHKEVNDLLLNELTKTCVNIGINVSDNRFNLEYLKRNIPNYRCSQSLKYLNKSRSLIALASYPGSGNTWTRELIETVTGLHTGSVYKDWNFEGSQLCPTRGKVFIIKTHFESNITYHKDCRKMGVSEVNFTKAILILRNPFDALVAEFNRQYSKKPAKQTFFNAGEGLASKYLFQSDEWGSFVIKESEAWKNFTLYWLETFDKPVYVLVYERVSQNAVSELYRLTKYLNINVTFQSLYCLSGNRTGNYHRKKPEWMIKESLYSNWQRTLINDIIQRVNNKNGTSRQISDALHSYLLPLF